MGLRPTKGDENAVESRRRIDNLDRVFNRAVSGPRKHPRRFGGIQRKTGEAVASPVRFRRLSPI